MSRIRKPNPLYQDGLDKEDDVDHIGEGIRLNLRTAIVKI